MRGLGVLRGIAQRVTITRDNWGIPHVSGTSDADVVFGVMYAQAEYDFNASRPTSSTPWAASPRPKASRY